MAGWLDGVVVENHQWSERLFSLRMRAPLTGFKAGQFVRVALDIDGEQVARPYSLVNAPGEEPLEIYFNIVEQGPLTPRLAVIRPGDAIQVTDRASGLLVIDEVPQCRYLWMLATGTGIGPFLSSLKTAQPWQRFDRVVLAYSVRMLDELNYRDTIERLLAAHPDQFRFVPFVTRERVEEAFHVRITDALASGEFEQRAGIGISAADSHVMMCGNSAMISQVSEQLQQRGLRKHLRREPGHITTEKYH
jgi:ferredoxin/flavodoxin---NADP+ reductase